MVAHTGRGRGPRPGEGLPHLVIVTINCIDYHMVGEVVFSSELGKPPAQTGS